MYIGIWLPIPDAPQYEINSRGTVRNVKTGKILKPLRAKDRQAYYKFYFNGRHHSFSRVSLLWLVHGVIPKKRIQRLSVPVTCSKDFCRQNFATLKEAAAFLCRHEQKSTLQTVRNRLSKRQKEIFGWKIKYWR